MARRDRTIRAGGEHHTQPIYLVAPTELVRTHPVEAALDFVAGEWARRRDAPHG